jgi:hypothetical protein
MLGSMLALASACMFNTSPGLRVSVYGGFLRDLVGGTLPDDLDLAFFAKDQGEVELDQELGRVCEIANQLGLAAVATY